MVFGVDLDDSTQQAFTASGDKVSGGERERERERERSRERDVITHCHVVTFMLIIACLYPVDWLDNNTHTHVCV